MGQSFQLNNRQGLILPVSPFLRGLLRPSSIGRGILQLFGKPLKQGASSTEAYATDAVHILPNPRAGDSGQDDQGASEANSVDLRGSNDATSASREEELDHWAQAIRRSRSSVTAEAHTERCISNSLFPLAISISL
jgi:hypothetical protein